MNQQLLETGNQLLSLSYEHDKSILEAQEDKLKIADVTSELAQSRDELAQYKSGEEQRWDSCKEFLWSPEFHDLLGAQASFLFNVGFVGATRQFRWVDYPPEGAPTDFLDLDDVLVEIPDS